MREKYPLLKYELRGQEVESIIPFSNMTKFGVTIRDMNKAVKKATTKEDNMMLIMKGAPERILSRCSKLLINGEEIEFDEEMRD